MKKEARRLFTKYKSLSEANRIEEKLTECEQRIELCIHYRNPYAFVLLGASSDVIPATRD